MNLSRIIKLSRDRKKNEQCTKSFHIAWIFRKNKVISVASNRLKSHPKKNQYNYKKFSTGVCAELRAVLKARRDDFSGCKIIILRIDNNNELAYSRPCIGCIDMIQKLDFSRAFYSNSKGGFESLK